MKPNNETDRMFYKLYGLTAEVIKIGEAISKNRKNEILQIRFRIFTKNLLAELNCNILNYSSRKVIPMGDSAHCDSQTERSRSLKVSSLENNSANAFH